MQSIIQDEACCFRCRTTLNLETHHIFGRSNRKFSEKYGLKIYLCKEHHTGDTGIHFDKEYRQKVQRMAQIKFEETYDEDFLQIFGRNYK